MAYSGGLYLADDISDHAQRRADEAFRGKVSAYIAHLVRTDMVSGGALDSFSAAELARWMAADRALLSMARHALTVLNDEDEGRRVAAARHLATAVIEAALRPAETSGDLLAAEHRAPYESTPAKPLKKRAASGG